MPEIKVKNTNKYINFESGSSLLELLLSEGIFIDNPCNGKGICGKCRVRITSGALEPSATEKAIIKISDLKSGVRLSCLVFPDHDMEIEPLQKERKHEVLTEGAVRDFSFEPDIRKEVIEIRKPTLSDQTPYEDQIREQADASVSFDLIAESEFVPGTATAVIHNGEVIDVRSGDSTDWLYGVAIDIGTTTVVCSLVDIGIGKEIANASMINAQKHYGLDVLTRITYAIENPKEGVKNLQKAIVDSINDMIGECCESARVDRGDIYEITVGANSTMMHLLLGTDVSSIGKAPYAPMFVRAKDISAEKIGIQAGRGARLYCLHSVSAYIGADIVAGAYVCDLKNVTGNVLFIDIGTNGEIVLSNNGKLLCCSCAAGPALEGMNISSGMRAAVGAIEDIRIDESGIELAVIGDEEPVGICGSGILAAVKELVRCGFLRKNGTFIKPDSLSEDDYRKTMLRVTDDNGKREFILTSQPGELIITQGDIRQVQLAKGAILSGFKALLNKAGIDMEELDKVLIAGQFGAHLPADSLTGTGILPFEVEDKIEYVGNSSKTGAYMALMSVKAKREMEELANDMDYMELGATEGYEKLFSECLIFPTK